MRKMIALAGLLVTLVACGRDAVQYPNAGALQDAVQAAGWGCKEAPDAPLPGEEAVYRDALTCTLTDGGFAQFVIFDSEKQRLGWRNYVSLTPATTIEGPNWAVTVLDADVAAEIADALGGEVDE